MRSELRELLLAVLLQLCQRRNRGEDGLGGVFVGDDLAGLQHLVDGVPVGSEGKIRVARGSEVVPHVGEVPEGSILRNAGLGGDPLGPEVKIFHQVIVERFALSAPVVILKLGGDFLSGGESGLESLAPGVIHIEVCGCVRDAAVLLLLLVIEGKRAHTISVRTNSSALRLRRNYSAHAQGDGGGCCCELLIVEHIFSLAEDRINKRIPFTVVEVKCTEIPGNINVCAAHGTDVCPCGRCLPLADSAIALKWG